MSTIKTSSAQPRLSAYWGHHVLRTAADSLWLSASTNRRPTPDQRAAARAMVAKIAKTPPRIVQPVATPAGENAYLRVYTPGAWDRAARNLHSDRILRKTGVFTPRILASGFVNVPGGYCYVIVEAAAPATKTMWQAHSDAVAAGIARDIARCRRHVVPSPLRPLFFTKAWRDPERFLRKSVGDHRHLTASLSRALVEDAADARRFDYSRRPTLGQTDLHGRNVCVASGGEIVWFDRDEFRIYPLELQVANVMLSCLHCAPARVDSFVETICRETDLSPSEWRRFRLLHLRTMAGIKFLTAWRNAPYLGRPNSHVEFYATRYLATHNVDDRGQSDSELINQIVEHWHDRRTHFAV